MVLEERYRVERTKWDALAPAEVSSNMRLPPQATFEAYASQSSLLAGAAAYLGDLDGQRVLEYGCGLGELSSLLAKSGARVITFDLSPRSVQITQQRAVLNQVQASVGVAVAAGERLPYADESFDVIFGKAILHHLDVKVGGSELYRVLKRGGKAMFVEPMGMNLVLNLVRSRIPYPHKHPRGADRPLTYAEIDAWGKAFQEFTYREVQLLSMLERGLGFKTRIRPLRQLDAVLLERLPFLRRYCRYVIMYMQKKSNA
jgi:SAM-dependent methyltransferase